MTESYYLVFTCNPKEAVLSQTLCQECVRPQFPDGIPPIHCLADNKAYEIALNAKQAHHLNHVDLKKAACDARVDANLVNGNDRRKQLLVADMEGTIIEQECLDELADFLNLRPQIADITARAMRGEIDFEPALKERVALLKGLPESTLEQVYREKVTLMSGAQTLIATMQAHGAYCALVSGGFSYYAEKIAKLLTFDQWRSNQLIISHGVLDGTVKSPILGRDDKAAFLTQWQNNMKLAPTATMAVGDGANDLAMLKQAGFGVAFHAKPAVADAAAITITHGDLTALLYLQGYREDEFVQNE